MRSLAALGRRLHHEFSLGFLVHAGIDDGSSIEDSCLDFHWLAQWCCYLTGLVPPPRSWGVAIGTFRSCVVGVNQRYRRYGLYIDCSNLLAQLSPKLHRRPRLDPILQCRGKGAPGGLMPWVDASPSLMPVTAWPMAGVGHRAV